MKKTQAINSLFACPCCGYATLAERGNYEICEICFWEDDGQDDDDQLVNRGGPNHISLKQARFNFIVHGASDKQFLTSVRAPSIDDIKLTNYRLVYDILAESSDEPHTP
ncbi:CPCC family cysteine-rich protein [Celerinatantimonas sp. MCCC 1A17872]|uniref:CPCC family cysteine-rich protein n=1 Tax=Celerinatantimonas sp. MCCC 1A17872 TaxID=3177514 RepID=UPI0038C7192D